MLKKKVCAWEIWEPLSQWLILRYELLIWIICILRMSTEPGNPKICLEFAHDLEDLDKVLAFNKNLEKAWNYFCKVVLFSKSVTKWCDVFFRFEIQKLIVNTISLWIIFTPKFKFSGKLQRFRNEIDDIF